MNRIVRKHYPAAKLPDELRGDIDSSLQVTVTIVVEDTPEKVSTLEELFALRRPPYLSLQQIDDHMRHIREEWHD
jgi:hypothetical protein